MTQDSEIDRLILEGEKKIELLRQRFRAADAYREFLETSWEEGLPHCDPLILHLKDCLYCARPVFKSLKLFRQKIGLPFTDELEENDSLIPGYGRTRSEAERWGGNRKGRMDDY